MQKTTMVKKKKKMRVQGSKMYSKVPEANPAVFAVYEIKSHPAEFSEMVVIEMTNQMNMLLNKAKTEIIAQIKR